MFVVVLSAHHHTRAESGPQIIHRSPLGLWVISTAQLVLRQGSQLGPIAHKVSRHKRCHLTLNHIIQKIPTYSKHAILLTSHLVQNKSSYILIQNMPSCSKHAIILKTSHIIQKMPTYSKQVILFKTSSSCSKQVILFKTSHLFQTMSSYSKQVIFYSYSKQVILFRTCYIIQNWRLIKTWHLTQNMPSYYNSSC